MDISALYIDQLRIGAAEPDFTDGDSSSKHSWNPRYDRSLAPFIRKAYPGEIASDDVIVAGAAPEAILEEMKKVEEIKRDLLAGACPDRFMAFARFYRALGRLSHYVTDVHSPFHANSFGLKDGTGRLKANDYHEGVFDPFAGGGWIRGLWDRGLPGRLAHGYNETYRLGSAADIPRIPCSECEGGVLDVDTIARQAAERMDSYYRAQGVSRRGRSVGGCDQQDPGDSSGARWEPLPAPSNHHQGGRLRSNEESVRLPVPRGYQ